MRSEAVEAVMSATHPAHEDGGPCHECAFRAGTQANTTEHTVALATMCVEGSRPFYCHVHPGLCRGFIAAANLRGRPRTKADKRHAEACGMIADFLGDAVAAAKAYDEQHAEAPR